MSADRRSTQHDAATPDYPGAMDDRAAFEAETAGKVLAMAADPHVREAGDRAFDLSDRYDYSYMWRWLGVPVIQTPDDIVTIQELIWQHRPQVIIETGFARGGSAILYSSILELLGEGRVVSVDIDIRQHNRATVEEHPLGHRVRFIEGSSTDAATLTGVRDHVPEGSRVMVVLDSDHTHEHVLEELRIYAPLVTPGQFLVVSDTVIEDLPPQAHRPRAWGPGDNPRTAVDAFLAEDERFVRDDAVNGKLLVTSSRGGYLRRRSTV